LEDIIDFLTDYLGINGTLVVPTFNFDFCKGHKYSAVSTISQMGTLTEIARKKANKNRTWHPVYSFVLFGNIPALEIKKKNYSAFGPESIFKWIDDVDGKIAVIDLPDQKSMTYYHHVEELKQVDWRFMKTFKGKYIDFNNISSVEEAKIYVRKLDKGVETNVSGMEKILWSKNLYKGHYKFSHRGCRSIEVKNLKKEVIKIIDSNKAKGLLYNIS